MFKEILERKKKVELLSKIIITVLRANARNSGLTGQLKKFRRFVEI